MKKIWCLFSIENNYDQPENNLEGWFIEKPSMESLINYFYGERIMEAGDLAKIYNIHQGQSARIGNTDYRLVEVNEGFIV